MAKELDRKRKFPKAVETITSGKQAQERAAHNKSNPYQPGEIRQAESPEPDRDRLDRALQRSSQADLKQREAQREQQKAGEVREAQSQPDQEQRDKEQVKRFLRLAMERFKLAADAESHSREEQLDDVEFRVGKQWPADVEMQRTMDGRPCLTMNRLPQFIRQVTNEQRQQRPSIQVNPVGDGADQQTAEVLQGTVRHVEVKSDAEVFYDNSFDGMVTKGIDWLRVLTDYADDDTWDQEIFIKGFRNSFQVYSDPSAVQPVREDMNWAFVIEDMPRDEYRVKYPNSEAAGLTDFTSVGDNAAEWSTRETIRVAEYFYVEEELYTQYRMPDGSISDQLPEGMQETQGLDARTRTRRKVKWAKINAIEVLEGNDEKTAGRDWPGKFIPLIPVIADDIEVNGKRHISGLVRHAKDPQRMYNYWVSAATEMIALAPKAPFVGAEGQFKNHEKEWAEANIRSFAKLEYSPVTIAGNLVPPPQRQTFEPPVQSINLMTRQADMDLKTTTGIYDPSLGQQKSDQSGKAINLLQKQSDISNLNYVDNLSRTLRHVGRIILDLIPKIYTRARIQRIIKPDGSVNHVIIHNGQPDEAQALVTKQINRVYDISQGDYDVTISVGPSYQSKRQEAVASMLALVQAYPDVIKVAGDLLIRNMDWPGHNEIADRIKKTLPPNLVQSDDGAQDPEQQVALLQAQLQQLGQQHAMLTETVQKQSQVINEKQIEAANKLDLERLKVQASITIAEINTKAQNERERMRYEHETWKELHGSAHEAGLQADDHQNALELQANEPTPQNGTGAATQ